MTKNFSLSFLMLTLFLAGVSAAQAQLVPSSVRPGRERERFTEPPPLRAQPGGVAISLPSTTAPAGAEKITVFIRGVRIVGSTVYSADNLMPLYADLVGRRVPVADVYDLARRITAKYGNDGYVLSRAIVPPQQLNPNGSIIKIEVIEGYIDRVEWPATLSQYRDFFSYYGAAITSHRPINIRTLERYLLLVSPAAASEGDLRVA